MSVELKQVTVTGDAGGPHVLITGGVHGDEFEPIAAIRRLIEMFTAKHGTVSGLRGRLTLVPVVNESAFLRGHRCADDGKDLARTCPGRADGTLTEQIAFSLSRLIRTADYYIDLHTGGTELSVFPLAGYVMHSHSDVLDAQRRMARAFNLPVIWGTAANLEGRSLSVARDADVPAIYCEYLGAATCSQAGIDAYVDGCLNVLAELGLWQHPLPADRVLHVVENPQPGSGHMQVCNPSPCTGYFHTLLKPGDSIVAGDLLGHVFPLDNSDAMPIHAVETGLVLVLRTFPRVVAGDSVGVILPLPG
jgi:predicted deacylase